MLNDPLTWKFLSLIFSFSCTLLDAHITSHHSQSFYCTIFRKMWKNKMFEMDWLAAQCFYLIRWRHYEISVYMFSIMIYVVSTAGIHWLRLWLKLSEVVWVVYLTKMKMHAQFGISEDWTNKKDHSNELHSIMCFLFSAAPRNEPAFLANCAIWL